MNNNLSVSEIRKLALLLLYFLVVPFFTISAQDTISVKGVVLNGKMDPVAGVAVGVEGSFELPSVTNESGEFSINVVEGVDYWLNVEPSADYQNQRIFINNRNKINILLSSTDIESGFNEIDIFSNNYFRRDIISSMSSVNAENINYTQALSIDEYMQGRIPGMHVVGRSGSPGSGAVTLIRGTNSLIAGNRPLYVIDGLPLTDLGVFDSNLEGFQYNPLLSINPLDISKISVFKDASLTAAYGSKASNGVIYIQTLDPSATETLIELDLRTGYSLAPENNLPQLNARQHKTLASELLFSSGMQEEQVREDYPNLFLSPGDDRFIEYQHNTNWQNIIFSNAIFNNLNIKVKGGDEIARYGLSFGYANTEGIIKNTGYDGYNLRFVSLLNIFTWLKMNAGVSMNFSNAQLKESGKVAQTSPILTSLFKSPMLNPYQYDDKVQDNDERKKLSLLAEVDELGVSNPLAVIENYEAENTNFNFTSTLGFIATLRPELDIHTEFGLNYNILKEDIFRPNRGMERYYDGEAINVSQSTTNTITSFYFNNYLTFNKIFNKVHSFSSATGINIMNNQYQLDWALTKNSQENDEFRLLQQGTSGLWEIGGANRIWNWISFYERIAYSYRDKYLLNATISLDGSSRIGANAKNTFKLGGDPFGLFYSLGGGWRISNESFLKNVAVIDELKLRVSYGRTGNDNIGESTATKYYRTIKFRETSGLYPALLPNDELTYEMVSQYNAGIDISVLGSRARASFDFYQSQTNNLLIYAPMESYFGYEFRPENNGKMSNQGLELSLFLRLIDKNFKWDIDAMYSLNKNEVLEIKGDKLVTGIKGAEIVNMEGEQANSFYGYLFNGVYATTQEAVEANLVNERLIPYQAGDAIYSDLSGPQGTPDGIINDFDKTIIGSSMPESYGGLSNTFSYGRWSLSAFMQFVKGNELFNYIRYQNESMIELNNQSTRVLDRWQYEGQQTEIPRALLDDFIGNADFSDRWIEDGSYVRLKNIALSYTIPDEFLAFKNAKFYISASNLFTLSNYLGFDPEFAHSFENTNQGVDYGVSPQPRRFTFGVTLGL